MCNKKHCCRNCHFLAKYIRAGEFAFPWNAEERKLGKVDDNYCPECHHTVWSAGIKPSLKAKLTEEIDHKRDNCFFYPVQEGMSFQAATTLQERDAQNSQLKRTNFYATIGLWTAGSGLILSVAMDIINHFWK